MIKRGNISEISKSYKDWFLGGFVGEHEFNTSNSKNFEIKWSKRNSGDFHPLKENIVSDPTCNSMAICVYGKFKYSFLDSGGEYQDYILENEGDFVMWNPDINHTVSVLEDALVLTVRWYREK
jgi:hypothetical protein